MKTARSDITASAIRCTAIVLAALTLSSAAAAQQSAGIIGQVKDESGAVLPGVTVTAKSPALQVPSVSAVTDQSGEYRLEIGRAHV